MAKRTDSLTRAGSNVAQLDPLLQHRSRMGALVLLARSDALAFTRLRELLAETDGNLGAHLRKLEEASYVEVEKAFVERKPVTWYSITKKGRTALGSHLAALESLIADFNGDGKSA